ncbi:Hypothetical protein I5071_78800 [Sandaracinus amylolyticus]|nr:Hypothetical protein I5071_78800 [Sandaracinus amylolyticus]
MTDSIFPLVSARFGPLPGDGVAVVGDALGGPTVIAKVARAAAARMALEREIAITLRLRDRALRRVRAVARDRERTTAILERVEGVTIDVHLTRAPDDATRVVIALLGTLARLHAAGIAHGDLKPEHVLVEDDGTVRVIDLGLATPLGAIARGGTHGYLAPDLLEGAPVSVASDLFALGATLRELALPPTIRAIVDACLDRDAARRPSSAGAAIAALGGIAGAGSTELEASPLDRVRCDEGSIVLVRAAHGSGRTALVHAWVDERVGSGRAIVDVDAAWRSDPWLALARASRVDVDDPARRAGIVAVRIGAPMVIDDADALDDDVRASVVAAARAIAIAQRGALVLVGIDDALARELVPLGAREVHVDPLDERAIARVLSREGARADAATIVEVHAATGGRAGDVARWARDLARHPEARPRDRVPAPQRDEDETLDLGAAERALVRGQPRRAAAIVRAVAPGIDDAPRASPAWARILARAEIDAGRLSDGAAILDALDPDDPGIALDHARVLERLGRHREARDRAGTAMIDLALRARAAVIAATSTLALGDPTEADRIADGALGDASDPAIRARLAALRSDAALRLGDATSALEHAALAEREARASGDPGAIAHAIARSASAYALSGDPHRARDRAVLALSEAERAGDVAALPPYVMNVATTEHALGEIADAITRYERAAELALRLGRLGSRAAALTNLAGLFALAGADADAERVLSAARDAAERAGAAIHVGQTILIDAEVIAHRDPARARERAREAQRAFDGCGAARQALEARLLESELGELDAALAFTRAHESALHDAGLGARAALVVARAQLARGALDEARRAAERAIGDAKSQGDRDLEARALAIAAAIHDRLGTGAGEALRTRAREAIGELAARFPAGLRERFLATPERAAIVRAPQPAATTPARLGEPVRRMIALLGRVLLEPDEQRVLQVALDEAVATTGGERAFLLLRRSKEKRPEVAIARNLDRDTIQKSRFRFSRSVAERVLATGEPLVTASASDDPELRGARSVLDLGLRSILCVPVRAPQGVIGALYLDHRFETARFGDADREMAQALADVIGLALENARLHREARARTQDLARAHEALRIESERKDAELERLTEALARGGAPLEEHGIVGSARSLRAALDVARRVAPSTLPVLIEGESGTGKELFARFVHDRSTRAGRPFVAINCGALPEALIESELFGHVRGSFTGALRDHPGVFRAADGGTLMLDEIGELPLRMQTRLLRVLQEREVHPIGAPSASPIDVRIVAATNRDLEAEVEAGRFRRDLFFRLNGVRLRLPSLRERLEDVPALAEASLAKIANEPGMRRVTLGRSAIAALVAHAWPGNVRELEQALRRAVAIADDDELGAQHFELGGRGGPARADAHRELDRAMVERALRSANGNRTAAARALGISRVTIHRHIERLGIDVPARPGRPRSRGE